MSAQKPVSWDDHTLDNKRVFTESDHKWIQRAEEDGGGIDWFRLSGGYCNGPECEQCGYHKCVHCNCGDPIPKCSKPPQPTATKGKQP